MSDFVEISHKELEGFEAYRELYATKNPPPEVPSVYSFRDAGLLYYGKIITTVSAVLLAGFRTAEQFYLSASQENVTLGMVEAVLSVLAIEGLILFLAADRAKRRERLHPFLETAGIVMALGISLLAGLGQSIRLVSGLDETLLTNFTTALAFGLAFASFVAYIAGEILGQELVRIELRNREMQYDYKTSLSEWENGLNSSWNRSQERKLARGKITESFRNFPDKSLDWRNLSSTDKADIAGMTTKQIVEKYGVSDRTATNWKVYSNGQDN